MDRLSDDILIRILGEFSLTNVSLVSKRYRNLDDIITKLRSKKIHIKDIKSYILNSNIDAVLFLLKTRKRYRPIIQYYAYKHSANFIHDKIYIKDSKKIKFHQIIENAISLGDVDPVIVLLQRDTPILCFLRYKFTCSDIGDGHIFRYIGKYASIPMIINLFDSKCMEPHLNHDIHIFKGSIESRDEDRIIQLLSYLNVNTLKYPYHYNLFTFHLDKVINYIIYEHKGLVDTSFIVTCINNNYNNQAEYLLQGKTDYKHYSLCIMSAIIKERFDIVSHFFDGGKRTYRYILNRLRMIGSQKGINYLWEIYMVKYYPVVFSLLRYSERLPFYNRLVPVVRYFST